MSPVNPRDLRGTIYDLRCTRYEVRSTRCDVRGSIYDVRGTMYEVRFADAQRWGPGTSSSRVNPLHGIVGAGHARPKVDGRWSMACPAFAEPGLQRVAGRVAAVRTRQRRATGG